MIKQTMFFSILIDLYFSTKQHYCNSKAVFTCKRANRSTKFVKKQMYIRNHATIW